MPVNRIAAAQRTQLLAGNLTSHDIDVSVNVNPNAGEYVYGIAAYGWTGEPSVSGDTISCTWTDGTPIPLLASPLLFGSDKNLLMGWIVENPAGGSVVASHSGIGTGLDTRSRFLTVGVWSQAQPLDLDNIEDAVVSAVGSTNVTTSGVTVPSILPASRVISAHLVGKGKKITDFTGDRVASAPSPSGNGQLLMGETRGAESVTPTISHNVSTGLWGSFGLNLDPAPLVFGAQGRHKAGKGAFGGSVYRFAEPHPDRFYVVPPVGTIGTSGVLAGNFVPSLDGVPMPVWPKDPDDTSDYTLDWSNHLADDDRITHVEHTLSGSLRKFSEAIDDNGVMTQVWVNGSTVNVTRSVRVRCSTARGRRFDRTFWLAGTSN